MSYQSFPYTKLVRYAVETRGTLQMSATIKFWFRRGRFKVDVQAGSANLLEVNEFLSDKLLRKRKPVQAEVDLQLDRFFEDGDAEDAVRHPGAASVLQVDQSDASPDVESLDASGDVAVEQAPERNASHAEAAAVSVDDQNDTLPDVQSFDDFGEVAVEQSLESQPNDTSDGSNEEAGASEPRSQTEKTPREKSSSAGAVRRWLGMVPKDPVKIAAVLRSVSGDDGPVLTDSEVVRAAYKGARDFLVFTDKRVIFQDKKGVTGYKVVYTSYPYDQIVSFEAKTAGIFDYNSEILLATERQDFTAYLNTKANIFLLQKIVAGCMLGGRALVETPAFEAPPSAEAASSPEDASSPEAASAAEAASSMLSLRSEKMGVLKPSVSSFVLGSQSVDAEKLTKRLRTGASKILMLDEKVTRALQAVRDLFIITTHRLLTIQFLDATGQRISYKTFVPAQIVEFDTTTPGRVDVDGEISVRCFDFYQEQLRVRKDEDIFGIQKDLAALLLPNENDVASDLTETGTSGTSALGGLFGGFRGEGKVNEDLHGGKTPVLFDDEQVRAVLEAWELVTLRDPDGSTFQAWKKALLVMSSMRLLVVTLKGDKGPLHHSMYTSVPYHNIRYFKAYALPGSRSGMLGEAGETKFLICTGSFMHTFQFAFGASADFLRFQQMLAVRVFKKEAAKASMIDKLRQEERMLIKQPVGWMAAGFGGFVPNRSELNDQFHSPPFDFLSDSEDVVVAYQLFAQNNRARSEAKLLLLTQWRVVIVSVEMPHVTFASIPYSAIDAFSVCPGSGGITRNIAGANQTIFLMDAEMEIRTATKVGFLMQEQVRRGLDMIRLQRYVAMFSR
eukprot:TRINITY_DN24760_c0_g1_i1.p1 TRINITY_DN24760_c0_g1~~TRINITY_DN24760_c0_g1_i1.p1  ORF type:complete len:986 (+),score=134.28 TRINITY_DN24760_c0_g1_i1:431-2959(+)